MNTPIVEEFLAELDRRIDSADSVHDEASKERLRKMRVAFHIVAAGEPIAFAKTVENVFRKFGIVELSEFRDFQPGKRREVKKCLSYK